MSAYSTLSVSRNAALLALARLRFGDMTNAQIEEDLENLGLKASLYNCLIVGDDAGPDDAVLEQVL